MFPKSKKLFLVVVSCRLARFLCSDTAKKNLIGNVIDFRHQHYAVQFPIFQ